ncbi:hypothetical protein [Paenibacillus sp. YIM B09110]|uniref:hypothetical protein n=1 Tax=Paenibacillus sp. YIM B09110 TaxID=3126102 RepID=UPI00301BE2BF
MSIQDRMKATSILLARLIETKGLAVRAGQEDDAFWYTSGNPGPFYINTENIAGAKEAELVLARITSILKESQPRDNQVKEIIALIEQTLQADKQYEAAIDALAEFYLSEQAVLPLYISGGERRDWFFSIPVARRLGLPHIFLFKNGDIWITDHQGQKVEAELTDQRVLHVADIINLASSYVDRWIPMLDKAGVTLTETLTVAVRSKDGLERLASRGVQVTSPLLVDKPLFAEALELQLISPFAYNEIIEYYESPKEWTRTFLTDRAYSQYRQANEVKRERIHRFQEQDPYELRSEFPSFFTL